MCTPRTIIDTVLGQSQEELGKRIQSRIDSLFNPSPLYTADYEQTRVKRNLN